MRFFLSFILIICFAQPAMAVSWFDKIFGPKENSEKTAIVSENGKETSEIVSAFSAKDKETIRDYFREKATLLGKGKNKDRASTEEEDASDEAVGKGKGKKGKSKKLPPGLAKKDTLPPGLAKQLEKNGTLPPGLAKKELPENLEGELSRLKRGTERVIVDESVVLVEKATGKVLDILRDVVLGTSVEQ